MRSINPEDSQLYYMELNYTSNLGDLPPQLGTEPSILYENEEVILTSSSTAFYVTMIYIAA